MSNKLLCTFILNNETYNVYGEYDIETDKELDYTTGEKPEFAEYKYPDFYDITIKKVIDGKEEDYVVTGETWAGRKYVSRDVIESVIAASIRGDDSVAIISLEDGLQKLVNEYKSDVAINYLAKDIPKKILSVNMYSLYQLLLVTDKYIYYAHDGEFLMMNAESHEIISDNYFAEVGLNDSIEDVRSGAEMLMYGELPEED